MSEHALMHYHEAVDISRAILPANYEKAKRAIAACERIDECQDWADRAAALASYAKQSTDDSLLRLAMRIQLQAVRRCGELMKKIPAHPGGRPKTSGGAPTSFSRTKPLAMPVCLAIRNTQHCELPRFPKPNSRKPSNPAVPQSPKWPNVKRSLIMSGLKKGLCRVLKKATPY
jgi:hypothetical protein